MLLILLYFFMSYYVIAIMRNLLTRFLDYLAPMNFEFFWFNLTKINFWHCKTVSDTRNCTLFPCRTKRTIKYPLEMHFQMTFVTKLWGGGGYHFVSSPAACAYRHPEEPLFPIFNHHHTPNVDISSVTQFYNETMSWVGVNLEASEHWELRVRAKSRERESRREKICQVCTFLQSS